MLTKSLRKAIAIAFVLYSYQTLASDLISDNFVVSGPVDNLTALFTNISTSTTDSFNNYVEIQVSGTGQSDGSSFNDAFYNVSSETANTGYYQLNMATGGSSLSGSEPTANVQNDMAFINNVGFVSPGAIPAYSATNTYDFVVNVGAAGTLAFGVADGDYLDNSGQYNITVSQLSLTTVPEPETLTLFAIGLLGLGLARKKAVQA
ncbi:MAG: PEP-CTERM sorting domain-containing protein [Methylomonas sp.]|jgi:hypothetical protein